MWSSSGRPGCAFKLSTDPSSQYVGKSGSLSIVWAYYVHTLRTSTSTRYEVRGTKQKVVQVHMYICTMYYMYIVHIALSPTRKHKTL